MGLETCTCVSVRGCGCAGCSLVLFEHSHGLKCEHEYCSICDRSRNRWVVKTRVTEICGYSLSQVCGVASGVYIPLVHAYIPLVLAYIP